ncbi:hypothetical protein HDV00_004584 [Rhizophlyctis rosea]|nr:hypothetical protein HDV00_004584 [Rhizophlyctis rosea]
MSDKPVALNFTKNSKPLPLHREIPLKKAYRILLWRPRTQRREGVMPMTTTLMRLRNVPSDAPIVHPTSPLISPLTSPLTSHSTSQPASPPTSQPTSPPSSTLESLIVDRDAWMRERAELEEQREQAVRRNESIAREVESLQAQQK